MIEIFSKSKKSITKMVNEVEQKNKMKFSFQTKKL